MHVQRWVSLLFCLLAFLPAVAVLAQETETRGGRSLTAGFHAIASCPACLVGLNLAYNIPGRKINQIGLHASTGGSILGKGEEEDFNALALSVSLWEIRRAGRSYDVKLSAGPALFLVEPGGIKLHGELINFVPPKASSGLLSSPRIEKKDPPMLIRPGGVLTGQVVLLPIPWVGIGIQLYTLAFAPAPDYVGGFLGLSAPTPGLVLYIGEGNY